MNNQKTTHSPAPWNYAPTGEVMQGYSQPFAIAQANTPNLIAGVFGDVRGGEQVAEANAKLIAAAPELLEALEHLHLVVMQSNDRIIFDNGINANIVAKAKEVILKATK